MFRRLPITTQTDIQAELPLTEATFFILLSLASGPRHGYAIIKEVDQLSRGRITLSTGTLYGALSRLLEQGWILRVEHQEAGSGRGRPRKDYILSELGRRILSAETARLESVLRTARVRLAEGNA
jgi:DNA-binding PadR family transcriptional regulator